MKKISLIQTYKQLMLLAGMLLLFGAYNVSLAQEDSTVVTEEAPSLISPSIDFNSVQKGDNTIDLKVGLRARVKGQFISLYKMKVSFYQVVKDEDIPLGFKITDGLGKAVFNVKGDSLKSDAEGKLQFKVVFAGNKVFESAEESVSFRRGRLEIIPVKEDSLLTVQVKLVDAGTGKETPVKETAVGVFVKRLFLPMKVGEVTTDENGEGAVEFPANLPGDAKGNLTLLARLDENETFGNMEAAAVQPWGVPVSDKPEAQPRALWSSHPPLWMLITFVVLMLAVWGHYIVIVYELFRLRKEQPHAPTHATNS
jgi:hypothetical protein